MQKDALEHETEVSGVLPHAADPVSPAAFSKLWPCAAICSKMTCWADAIDWLV